MAKFTSTKLFDGYSTCFRQWKATDTHCSYLHGYALSFRVWFEGELDHRNWVFDFGGMKRSKHEINGYAPKDYFSWLLDHTVIIANDDPELDSFRMMDTQGLIQLRIIDATGAEKFAEYIYHKLNEFVQEETNGRVRVVQVEFMEHNKNTAIYEE